MALPNPKELVKLAKACRQAGIKTFKCGDVEFTLTDEVPVSPYKQAKAETAKVEQDLSQLVIANDPFHSDAPTQEQLLYWSSDVANEVGQAPIGDT